MLSNAQHCQASPDRNVPGKAGLVAEGRDEAHGPVRMLPVEPADRGRRHGRDVDVAGGERRDHSPAPERASYTLQIAARVEHEQGFTAL
jgi:hypothetical protein